MLSVPHAQSGRIGSSAAGCVSFHRSRSAHVIRPSGNNAVASTMTRPAPPRANEVQ
jgi:hypothetical protein